MIRTATMAACAWLAATAALAQAPPPPPEAPTRATVETGVLVGVERPAARVFRNIPYAAPPVGSLRWAPPMRAQSWQGERPATGNGISCVQPMDPGGRPNLGAASGPTSEDCLQLNVFAPKTASKAPVMVWLHGGGYYTGAGWLFNGESFARDGVVFVAINYRLGALGYFAHPALTAAAKRAEPLGAYGLMDQIAALEWVKRNIAAFGGDPRNVTVLGESAGGGGTLALLATPSARGLFKKAIVQSGGGWSEPVGLAEKEAEGVAMMAAAGLSADAGLAEMRALPSETINALGADYGPFVDGRLMTETPAQAFARGHATDVPLIIGSNSGEDSLMGAGVASPSVARLLPPSVRAAYPAGEEETLIRDAFTDRYMGAPARWIAAKAAAGKPSWLYHFSYVGARFRPKMTRAAHAAEIQYMLEYWGRRTPLSTVSADDLAMARLMHGCWVAFAKTGRPACGTQAWPAYGKPQVLMEFGAESGPRRDFRDRQLDAQEAVAVPTLKLNGRTRR